MTAFRHAFTLLLSLATALGVPTASTAQTEGPLRIAAVIELPDISGRMDHLALDAKHQRLLVAALGAGEVEVIDLQQQRRVERLRGLDDVQGLAYAPALNRLFVAVGGKGELKAFEGAQATGSVGALPDADNLRLSPSGDHLYLRVGRHSCNFTPKETQVLAAIHEFRHFADSA